MPVVLKAENVEQLKAEVLDFVDEHIAELQSRYNTFSGGVREKETIRRIKAYLENMRYMLDKAQLLHGEKVR